MGGIKKESVLVFQGEENFILPYKHARKSQKHLERYKAVAGGGMDTIIQDPSGGGDNIVDTGTLDVADYDYKDISTYDCEGLNQELQNADAYKSHNWSNLTLKQKNMIQNYINSIQAAQTTVCPHQVPLGDTPISYPYPDWASLDCATLDNEINKLVNYMETGSLTTAQMQEAGNNITTARTLYSNKCIVPTPLIKPPAIIETSVCNAVVSQINVSVTEGTVNIKVDMTDALGFSYDITKAGAPYTNGVITGNSTSVTNVPAGEYNINVVPKCETGTGAALSRTFTVAAYGASTATLPILPVASVALGSSLKTSSGGGGGGGSTSTASKTAAVVKKGTNWWLLLLIASGIAGGVYYFNKKGK